MMLIGEILTAVTSIFTQYNERKKAEHAVIIAQTEARKELAKETIKAELEFGSTQIKATGKAFKYITFFIWFTPFIVSTVLPSYAVIVFENLSQLPDWYVQACIVLMFAVWGIQVGKNTIMTIFSNLGSYLKRRQKLAFHRKLFYDTVRSVKGNITQHEVDLYEKALDKALKDEQDR